MKRLSFPVLLLAITGMSMIMYLASCGGGGGGGYSSSLPPPSGAGTGANGVAVFWYPYDTNIAMGTGNAVRETSDHGFVVAGSQSSMQSSSPHDVFLMKTDAKGAAAWKQRFPWPGGADATAVRQTSDSGYIITGQTNTQGSSHRVYVLKTDAGGNAEGGWPKIFGGASDSVGYDVLEIPGGYLIAGYTIGYIDANQQPHQTVYVICTDVTGSVLWENKSYTSFCIGGSEFGRALAATPDGNYVVAGTTLCNGVKGFLLKIDGQDGHELWRNVYGTSPASTETIYSVVTTTTGESILAGSWRAVSGQPPVAGPPDALVIKADVNGKELWRRTYGGADQDETFSVALAQQNDVVLFGYTQSYGGTVNPAYPWQYQDLFLTRIDSNGKTLWQKVKGNRPMGSDFGTAGCAVSDGGFAVTGSTGGNVLLAKFDANGNTINLGATDLSIAVPDTMGVITFANAIDAASAGVTAIMSPRNFGAAAVDLLIPALQGQTNTGFCTSGTYTFIPTPTVSAPSTTLSFTGCETGSVGDSTTLNGSVAINVTFVTQPTPTYTIQTTLTDINITAAETGGTLSMSITGGMRFYRMATATQMSERSESVDPPDPAATSLTFSETDGAATRTRVLGPFIVRDVVTIGGAYYFGLVAGDSATVDAGFGPLVVTFPSTGTPVVGPSLGAAPVSGSFQVTAPADSSQLTATITNGVAALAVDTDADGNIDGTVSAPWDFLD